MVGIRNKLAAVPVCTGVLMGPNLLIFILIELMYFGCQRTFNYYFCREIISLLIKFVSKYDRMLIAAAILHEDKSGYVCPVGMYFASIYAINLSNGVGFTLIIAGIIHTVRLVTLLSPPSILLSELCSLKLLCKFYFIHKVILSRESK